MDRIDIIVGVPRLSYDELHEKKPGESSETVRYRVARARDLQLQRFLCAGITCNAQMNGPMTQLYCSQSTGAASLLKASFRQFKLSARLHDRLLKVARTIADLAGSEIIEEGHLAEALQYRPAGGG